jgi:hypothetical protein
MLTPQPAHEKLRFWVALAVILAGTLSPFLALLG